MAGKERPPVSRAVTRRKPRPSAAPPARTPRTAFKRTATPAHARVVYERLAAQYPDAHCELDFANPFQLIVATILSAQCTDRRVNMVTPGLFASYPTPRSLADADPDTLEGIIRSTGFFRAKTRSLIGMARAVAERHGGRVPDGMDALVELPGVGRKTANVVLGNAFAKNEGIVVDTHVARVSARLGLTRETDPIGIETSLVPLFPRERWAMLSHLLIWHGRRVCVARTPRCGECVLSDVCPSARVVAPAPALSPRARRR